LLKRTLGLLLMLLVLAGAGCSKAKPTTAPPPPAPLPTQQSEPPKPEPAKPPEPIGGPIYLLEQPAKPLWAGPAAVVVENSPQSRPQAGLLEADLVVEGLSESEVTRTLAFYWSRPAAKIGPVRSARTWLVAMADAYGAPFAHAGGNNDALAVLRSSWGPRNLDEIYTAGGYFWRTKDREAPWNLYDSTDLLSRAVTERGISMKPVPTTPRAVGPAPQGDIVTRVDIHWHKLHDLAWEWDGKQYRRLEDGTTVHKVESGDPIVTPNLVLLDVTGVDNGWELGWALDLSKGGKATVISGGARWDGTWKLGAGGFALEPAAGAKVSPLLPGPVWVELVTAESSYKVTSGKQ
jgi:hypothetical protein